MIDLLLEGTESLRLPCSWLLIIPGTAVALSGRRRAVLVTVVFTMVAIAVAWLRFTGFWSEWFGLGDVRGNTQIVLGVGILAAAALAWKKDSAVTDGLSAGVAGLAGAWAWIPCVGPHLGDVINGAGREPFVHIPGTIAFIVGLFIPFIIVAATDVVFPIFKEKTSNEFVTRAGFVLIAVVGVLFAVTLFDDLANELARRSTF